MRISDWSSDVCSSDLKGRGGHAAMPHDCVDPIPVACEIVTALQTFIARQVPVADPAVLTIATIEAGPTPNIIPGEAKLLGTLRPPSGATRATMQASSRRIVTPPPAPPRDSPGPRWGQS